MSSAQPPSQRWQLHPAQPLQAQALADRLGILPPVAQVLLNRGLGEPQEVATFLQPDRLELPDPATEFADLSLSVDLLAQAIAEQQKIAICGDYDADGMTSTALLLRALRALGGRVDYAIPSRMQEGYGLNSRIVREFHQEGVGLILTVDNGIAAHEPIALARQLGLVVIVTDHHDLPPQLPVAHAILNPKLLREGSPYGGLAGVGVAYVLARTLAARLMGDQLGDDWGKHWDKSGDQHREEMGTNPEDPYPIQRSLLELFTLGTIADLAPLTGVNRCWVKQGLRLLPSSRVLGIQALMACAHVQAPGDNALPLVPAPTVATLKPDDIGFRLGPRINAIGRIGDPQVVIELLTTEDPAVAHQRAQECEAANQERRHLCDVIEQEAIALAEQQRPHLDRYRVLLLLEKNWHHGVIGIVASRLVERYGVPVFIATFEEEEGGSQLIRGSARGIPEFHVAQALEFCHDLLHKHGGHQAAGGFSLPVENFQGFHQRLVTFAHQCLNLEHLRPLVVVDGELPLHQVTSTLYEQIDRLHPWGIGNIEPVFCSYGVQILEQKPMGKDSSHLRLTLATGEGTPPLKVVAWRWGDYYPLPDRLDLAYRLRQNEWKGRVSIELELVGVQLGAGGSGGMNGGVGSGGVGSGGVSNGGQQTEAQRRSPMTPFVFQNRPYTCAVYCQGEMQELRIRNDRGQVLVVQEGQNTGLLGVDRASAQPVNVQEPHLYALIQAAVAILSP